MNLFFFDYDGTLHQHGSAGVSLRTRSALKALQKAGHKIILCTGRCPGHLPTEILDLHFDCYATACGAATLINNTMLFEHCIAQSLVLEIMRLFEYWKLDGAVEGEKRILFYQRKSDDPKIIPEVHSFQDFLLKYKHMPVYKLTLFQVPMPKPVAQFLRENQLSVINNSNTYYEIIQKGYHKGKALKDIASYYHVPLNQTFSFGDSMNDADMLLAAAHGIVVDNAPAEVKALADEIVPSVENDGVAYWIENFLNSSEQKSCFSKAL